MLDIKLYKNNEYQEMIVEQGFTIKKTLNEELNELTLKFSSYEENTVALWQSVKLENDYFVVTYIQKDERPGKRYAYIAILSEPTKYLEKVFCPAMAFTNKTDTLKEQIEKALMNAEPVEVGNEPRFRLSNGIKAYFNQNVIDGADFYFDKMTLREVLDGFFAKIDSRVIVRELTDFNDIVIDFVSLAKRNRLINTDEHNGKRTIESVEMLGSDIESYADNALVRVAGFSDYGHLLPIYHPSPTGWDTFKTNEATLTSNNAVISTTYPIERIVMFNLPGPFILIGHQDAGHGGGYDDLLSLDSLNLAPNMLLDEEYSALYEAGIGTELVKTTKFYKENTISYTRGDPDIRNVRHSRGFFGAVKVSGIKTAAENVFWNSPEVQNEIAKGEYNSYTYTIPFALEDERFGDLRYRIIYIPQLDAHLKIGKEGYTGPPATIISQQSDRQIDIVRYGDNLYGQINRLGNPELEIDRIVKDKNELWEPGDYTEDNYILTTATVAVFNNFLKCHYQFTENFNALSTKIGIDRQRRIYNIPLEYFRSDTIIKHYIIAHFGSPSTSDKLVDTFMYSFGGAPGSSHITNVLVKTKWTGGESDWLELSLIGYGASNTTNFQFRFKDNFSAGMSIGNQVIGGKKVIPNPYCNSLGEYDEIEIRLFNGRIKKPAADELERAKKMPKVSLSEYNNDFIYTKTFSKKKDAYEHQGFTVSFEIVSLEDDIVIGPALALNCGLWQTMAPTLYVYVADKKYHRGDKKVAGKKAINQSIHTQYGSVGVSFSDTNIKSWAIGDADGNLYVACNRPNEKSVQFQFRNKL